MAFETLSLDEKHALCVAMFKAVFPTADVSVGSHNWLWCKTVAGASTDTDAFTKASRTDLMPGSSSGELLVEWANTRGVVIKGATPARKDKAGRFTGTALTNVPDGTTLKHQPSGLRFRTQGADVIGPANYVDVDIVAIDTGSKTRLSAGEHLTIENSIAGINDDVELQLDLDEDGTDQEAEPSIQSRVVSRFRDPPLGGTAADYVEWALDVAGFVSAYTYPVRYGLGTVHIAALHAGSGNVRVPSAPEVADLQALLDLKRPVSVKAFKVLQVSAEPNNVIFTYVPDGAPEHEPDWDDTVPPTVIAWNAGTRTAQLSGGALPATMKEGDRVIFSDGVTGRERVIESIALPDNIVLEADADGDVPTAGASTVYAGGPLCEPIRQAIQGLIDSLGTSNPDTKRYDTWEGNLRPSAIGRVATAVDGCLDGTVVLPVVTITASDPAFPDGDTVGLITAGRLIARRQ